MNNSYFIIAIIVLLYIITWLVLPQLLYRRAVKHVIKIFTKYNCFSTETARTPRDLGLAQRGWIQNLGRTRDYKPRALQMLIDYEIVRKTADDRVYLDKVKAALHKLG